MTTLLRPLILEADYQVSLAAESSGTREAKRADPFLDRLSQGKGRIILTASDANEVSAEKEELQHGVFTYYLLEALRGQADFDGDGVLTMDEVYRYVSDNIPPATGQEQHPVKKGEMIGQPRPRAKGRPASEVIPPPPGMPLSNPTVLRSRDHGSHGIKGPLGDEIESQRARHEVKVTLGIP